MKKLLSISTVLILTAALFTGCQQDPNSGINNSQPMAAKAKADAHPAWTFFSNTMVHSTNRSTVGVSDVDGTDNTNVYTCATTGPLARFQTWSPSGTSISFVETPPGINGGLPPTYYNTTVWGNYIIKSVDVSVTGGVVSGSSARTIYSVTTADSMKIVSQCWCPSTTGAGAGKIAFMVHTPTQSRIYTVSENGGPATQVYFVNLTDNRLNGESLTWSNDGNNLAFSQYSGENVDITLTRWAIKIIDLSGNVVTTLLDGSYHIGGCRWSNTGTNKIAFWMTDKIQTGNPIIGDFSVYTINTTAGSARELIIAASDGTPAWSPDNTELAIHLANGTNKVNVSTPYAVTFVGTSTPYGDWK